MDFKDLMTGKHPSLWQQFAAISAIPRCSGQEQAVLAYIRSQAEAKGLSWQQDKTGNLVVRLPAAPGRDRTPTIVLQGHVDMVCEQNRGTNHDFSCQGIELRLDGDWLRAEGTTLGADNGIAVAYMLSLFDRPNPDRGPIECLFTVDEETALTGALGLDPALLTGRLLINLDSEDEGVFTIGCAGGLTTWGQLPLTWQATGAGRSRWTLSLEGLPGGHSGVNIHEGRGNAIKLLVRLLAEALASSGAWSLANLEGGDKHNAIPREAFADLVLTAAEANLLQADLPRFQTLFREELGPPGAALTLKLAASGMADRCLSFDCRDRALQLLTILPHGVAGMSQVVPGLVESSSNLAAVKFKDNQLQVLTSQRSSRMGLRDDLGRMIVSAFALAGGSAKLGDGYPAWPPRADSPLLAQCRRVYQELTGRPPKVELIHAGLECGVIGDKVQGMDMISLGPDLREVHTPQERLSVPSAERTYEFLLRLLASF